MTMKTGAGRPRTGRDRSYARSGRIGAPMGGLTRAFPAGETGEWMSWRRSRQAAARILAPAADGARSRSRERFSGRENTLPQSVTRARRLTQTIASRSSGAVSRQ